MGETRKNIRRAEKMRRRHVIDMLFPIALFLVLAASSLFLVILAATLVNWKFSRSSEKEYQGG